MIYDIGYYNCDPIRDEERIVAPAAENKMGYIISALREATEGCIEVVSPAQTKANRFLRGKKQEIEKDVILKTFSSFNSKHKLLRIAGHMLTRTSFFWYLLKKVKREDHLLVYHLLIYMNIIKCIQKIKKCKLTIEVEELYSDVMEDTHLRRKELRYLQIADSYIFVTELL